MSDGLDVRDLRPSDRVWAEPLLFPTGPPFRVASSGVLHDVFDLDGLVAERDGRPLGVSMYAVAGDQCELVVLHSAAPNTGAGSALIAATAEAARTRGCRRLWLNTTNDNTRAIRFYQRRGMRLAAVRIGAVDRARAELKPEIPLLGDDEIPIRDELEFELVL